uniref:Cytochrome P450 n=1 Tax=Nothapodytes nimmoniana TaxID=159386 RepID=A0A7L7RB90_NOTNI|nr:cytochrome P450 [Nothapodytes nimmoniana]
MLNAICNHLTVDVLITVLAILWLSWAFKKLKDGRSALPPGPRGLPVVGYLPFLRPDLDQLFLELAQVHGPTFKLWVGHQLWVVLSSPSVFKQILRDQDMIFSNRHLTAAGLVFSGGGNDIALAPSCDSNWRTLRKIFVGQMLSKPNLDSLYRLRRHEVRKTVVDLYNNKIDTPIDVGELIFVTLFNSIISMLWGSTLEGDKWRKIGAEFRHVVSQLSATISKPNVSDFFPILARFDLQKIEKEMEKNMLWIDQIFDRVMDERKKIDMETREYDRNDEAKDFLQFLLQLKEKKGSETVLTPKQIKALLADVVLGATDTTSATIEWAMVEIIKHPEVKKKIYEELANVVGESNIVEELHQEKLQYLNAVVKETLRLHSPAPFLIPRFPSQTTTVDGYIVPAGCKMFLNVYAMHRDPQIWENPMEFQPERFLSSADKLDFSGNNFRFLPFGSGRRICAGVPLADRMLSFVLASFLHSFEWKLPEGTELDFSHKLGIATRKAIPLVAIPTPRLSDSCLYA